MKKVSEERLEALKESQNQMFLNKNFRKEIKKGDWMKVKKHEIDDFILQLSKGLLKE